MIIANSKITRGLNQYPMFLKSGIWISSLFILQKSTSIDGALSAHPFFPAISSPSVSEIYVSTFYKDSLLEYSLSCIFANSNSDELFNFE